MPRTYRLGERAVQMQATRDRIVEAAIELSIEVGISKATMRQVGLRADVAPGTLRNHFPSRQSLEEAMVERLTAESPLPDASIFDGADTLEERVGRLLGVTGTFFDQAGRLYRMWLRAGRRPHHGGDRARAGLTRGPGDPRALAGSRPGHRRQRRRDQGAGQVARMVPAAGQAPWKSYPDVKYGPEVATRFQIQTIHRHGSFGAWSPVAE
jgi:AcrR family transcriptional regulator